MMRKTIPPIKIGAALLALTAAFTTARAQDSAAIEELKGLNDPTILERRAWFDYEWNRFRDDSGFGKLTLGGMWAWRAAENQDWAVRMTLPYAWHEAGNAEDDHNTNGLGDIEMAAGTAFRLGKSLRTGGGLELHADTATSHTLGDNVWRLKPFWSLAWDVRNWLTLGFTAEYSHSIYEENGVARQRYGEFYFPATLTLPHLWSVSVRYKGKLDFENNDRWINNVRISVAKRLDNVPVSIEVAVEKDINGSSKEFQTNLILTYYFK